MSIEKLFGSSGIRGDAKEFFTDQLTFDLGRVFSIFLNKHNSVDWIAVGMDPRESSPRIKMAFISGLLYEGRKVFDQGVTPIPSMNWILKSETAFSGSVMVSGSHVKPHLNGLKFFAFGEEILKIHEEEIQSIFNEINNTVKFDPKMSQMASVVEENQAQSSYIEYILSNAKLPYKKMKIVIDAGNGAQSKVAPEILKRLNFDVVEQNTNIQDQFMSRDTEVSGDFDELQKRVISEKADLGIGFDSDGDRVVFIDENGNFISGDYSGTLIATTVDTDSIVTPVNTSSVVESIGKSVHRTRVGSPFVVGKMKEVGSKFGFEANGGGIFSQMMSRDGGRSMIEFLNLLNKKNMKVSELVSTLPKYYINRDKIDYKWELKEEIISSVKIEFKGIKVDETDGLKIWTDENTWILFRSSANAPEFRVFVESDDEIRSKELLELGLSHVNKIINK